MSAYTLGLDSENATMTARQLQTRLKKVTIQRQWRVPPELRKYVCSNDEIIEKTKPIKLSFADVVLEARRGVNGASTR